MSRRKEKLEASLEGLFSSTKRGAPAKKPDLPDGKLVLGEPVPAGDEALGQKAPEETQEKPVTVSSPPKKPVTPPLPKNVESELEKATPSVLSPQPVLTQATGTAMVSTQDEALAKQAAPEAIQAVGLQTEERVVSSTELLISEDTQVVVFMLRGDYYGVDISDIQTIIKPQPACPVPHTDDYLVGLINLRGQVVPVIDLRKRLNFPAMETSGQSRIIIVSVRDEWAGLLVDAVTGVQFLPSDSIEPPSLVLTSTDVSLLSGIAKSEEKLILILDVAKVFSRVR